MTILDVLAQVRSNHQVTIASPETDIEYIARVAGELDRRNIKVEVSTIGRRHTLVLLTMEDGWEQVGTSACKDPHSFSIVTGVRYALQDAVEELGRGFFYDVLQHPAGRGGVANATANGRDTGDIPAEGRRWSGALH